MVYIKDGPLRRSVDLQKEFIYHFGAGVVATDGVQYTTAATFGTAALEIVNQLIEPGYGMYLKEIQVGLTQKFTNLLNAVGSLTYSWKARSEYTDPRGSKHVESYYALSATYGKGIGSLSNSEDTLSGYLPPESVIAAPVRMVLTAQGLAASTMTGAVKNSSFVRLLGIVIPGT